MNYRELSEQINKPTSKWSMDDVKTWLQFISMSGLIEVFGKDFHDTANHRIDGSCLHALDAHDLEKQIGIKSKITQKKIMKWVEIGFKEFDRYIDEQPLVQTKLHKQYSTECPPIKRNTTELMRDSIKPENKHKNQYLKTDDCQMIVTTYEGPHANFYTITDALSTIGRSQRNSIVVLQESASKFHAQIMKNNGKFYIKDIGTESGTFIKVFEKVFLKIGMIIEMGSFQFTITELDYDVGKVKIGSYNTVQNQVSDFQVLLGTGGKKTCSFGRKTTNDFSYDDQHLSGIHARINILNGKFVLEDMSSTNGYMLYQCRTWIRIGLSKTQSEPFQLYDGCVFKIGTTSTYICKMNSSKKQNSGTGKIQKTTCGICHKNDLDCVFVPCKHNATCYECSSDLKNCLVCRTPIEQKIKIYI